MPGSRSGEIKHLLPTILESARLLKQHYPSVQFLLPLAPTISINDIQIYLNKALDLPIHLVQGASIDAIQISDAVIVASGTASLEIALLGKPMVIIYKLAALSYFILKRLAKVERIGLCNIIAGKYLVPELIQKEANPEKIAEEIMRFFEEALYRKDTEKNLSAMKKNLGGGEASKKVAALAMQLLSNPLVAEQTD